MKTNLIVMLLASGLVFTFSACQRGQDNTKVGAPPEPVTEKDASTLMVDEVFKHHAMDLKSQVKKAIHNLTGRLDVPTNEILTVRAENVTWRDGSLGCPKQGMFYTQTLVPGTLIILRVNDKEHDYHAGSTGDPFHCPNPQLPAPSTMAE